MEFHEYPKMLHHAKKDAVIVHNKAEESSHIAQGYKSKSDRAAFENAHRKTPINYIPKEYPKWVNGKIVEGPE